MQVRAQMSMDADKADAKVAEIAREIARYLAKHPHAADSIEGIRRWWLMRERYEESAHNVQLALEQLQHDGLVARRVLSDGSVLYTGQTLVPGEQ
jgi:hypothetical protein